MIKSDRPLYRVESYEPDWPWLEAVKERHEKIVILNEREAVLLQMLRDDPDFMTLNDAEIIKYAFFDWYLNSFVQ